MRTVEKKEAKGSLRWIRTFVNDYTSTIDQAVKVACSFSKTSKIKWVSPLANDDFAEYRDHSFLQRLQIELPHFQLNDFWPNRGPQWDALAKTTNGEIILVEAKANIPEIVSPGTLASRSSKEHIEKSLSATKEYLGVPLEIPWSGKLYQYANRIAHLYLLRKLNQIPAYMVFVYFIGDDNVDGPGSIEEWKAATMVTKRILGLSDNNKLSKYIKNVYLDVRNVQSPAHIK